jgi:hypothetical protein
MTPFKSIIELSVRAFKAWEFGKQSFPGMLAERGITADPKVSF